MVNLLTVMLLCDIIVLSSGGSLHLIGSPSTATEGDLFTLTCGNRSSGSRAINWYLNDSMVFTTNYELGAQNNCTFGIPGSSPYRYMTERVTISCDTHQHNVTLTINATLDSGSVWVCENNTAGQVTRATSVKLIIRHVTRATSKTLIINVTTVSTSTYGSSTSSSTLEASISDNNTRDIQNDLHMAAAAAGGAVVAVLLVLAVLWVRRRLHRFRNGRQIDGVPEAPDVADPSTGNVYDSPSAPGDMEHQYCQVQGGAPNYVNRQVVNAATDVTAKGDAGDAHYYSSVGNTEEHRTLR